MTTLRPELLDELLADYETPEDLLGDDGLFRQLKMALLERALGAELSDHLGYEKGDPAGRRTGNSPSVFSKNASRRVRRFFMSCSNSAKVACSIARTPSRDQLRQS